MSVCAWCPIWGLSGKIPTILEFKRLGLLACGLASLIRIQGLVWRTLWRESQGFQGFGFVSLEATQGHWFRVWGLCIRRFG